MFYVWMQSIIVDSAAKRVGVLDRQESTLEQALELGGQARVSSPPLPMAGCVTKDTEGKGSEPWFSQL